MWQWQPFSPHAAVSQLEKEERQSLVEHQLLGLADLPGVRDESHLLHRAVKFGAFGCFSVLLSQS